MSEVRCPKCGESLVVRLERVAAGTPWVLPPAGVPQTAPTAAKATITVQQLSDELDKLPWKETKTGKGWWAKFESLPQEFRAKFTTEYANGNTRYLRVGGYVYGRYGDQNEYISRYAAKVGEKKQ